MFYVLLFNQACKYVYGKKQTAEAINIGIPKSYRIEDVQNGIESWLLRFNQMVFQGSPRIFCKLSTSAQVHCKV